MVPFAHGLDDNHNFWNNRHSTSARMVVERSFGILKGIWRILSKIQWKPKLENVGLMIYTCCLLHNLMVEHQEPMPDLDRLQPHPIRYNSVLLPTREFLRGKTWGALGISSSWRWWRCGGPRVALMQESPVCSLMTVTISCLIQKVPPIESFVVKAMHLVVFCVE